MNIHQFSIQSLMILTAMVALFFALHRSYVFGNDFPILLYRAHQMPPSFATLSVLFCAFSLGYRSVRSLVLAGLVGAILVATALTVEIAEGMRDIHYWNWWSNLPTFLKIVGCHAVLGAAIGFILAFAFRLRI